MNQSPIFPFNNSDMSLNNTIENIYIQNNAKVKNIINSLQ